MPLRALAGLILLLALPTAAAAQAHPSGYAEGRSTQVKTLSLAEVDQLLAGAGMGMALPAELNGYPGPRHVLELADSLALTPGQRSGVEAIFQRMEEAAKALGARVVEAEKDLDVLFAEGRATPETLAAGLKAAEALRAELRRVHLAAHLETKPLLSVHQVHIYGRLRGYGNGHAHPSR